MLFPVLRRARDRRGSSIATRARERSRERGMTLATARWCAEGELSRRVRASDAGDVESTWVAVDGPSTLWLTSTNFGGASEVELVVIARGKANPGQKLEGIRLECAPSSPVAPRASSRRVSLLLARVPPADAHDLVAFKKLLSRRRGRDEAHVARDPDARTLVAFGPTTTRARRRKPTESQAPCDGDGDDADGDGGESAEDGARVFAFAFFDEEDAARCFSRLDAHLGIGAAVVDADRVPLVQMLGEAATTQTREEPVGAAPTAAADAAESGAERASVEEVVEDVEDDVDAAVPDVDDAFVVVKREAIELGDERDAIILDAAATPCDPMDADETRAEARGGDAPREDVEDPRERAPPPPPRANPRPPPPPPPMDATAWWWPPMNEFERASDEDVAAMVKTLLPLAMRPPLAAAGEVDTPDARAALRFAATPMTSDGAMSFERYVDVVDGVIAQMRADGDVLFDGDAWDVFDDDELELELEEEKGDGAYF